MEFYQSHRHRIYIAADDFGISPRANRNTLFLLQLGKIDRVGIMPLGSISPKEIDELAGSGAKLDIHLDILHEFHTSRKKRTGVLWRVIEFSGKIISGKLARKKIEADWRNQMEKFREIFGRNPDGINSHEHIHFYPVFFGIVTKLQQEYSIPYLRFGDSVSLKHHTLVSHILHWMRVLDQKKFRRAGGVSSQTLLSLDWIDDPEKFLDDLPAGITEIACHPEMAADFVKIKNYF